MRKFVLIIILLILSLSFSVFLYKAYIEQKNYFDSNNKLKSSESQADSEQKANPSVYKDYTKVDYDNALAQNRVVVLFFTSNWCAECQAQDVINTAVFNEIKLEGVVGIKIHILDSETTTEFDAIAKKFDVTKENTYVVLDKLGAVYYKYTGEISSEVLNTKLMEVTNK